MSDQLETMICILLSMIVCQGIQILCQWFIHSELMELSHELRRIANCLERRWEMSEKIYCKDCRFCQNGFCHRRPPFLVSWHKDALFPKVDNFDWCGMAERREDVKPGVFDINKIEAGDVVYFTSNKEIGKMKAENNRLRGLIAEIREFLIEGAVPGRFHLKQECIREIYTIAHQEDQKRRQQ